MILRHRVPWLAWGLLVLMGCSQQRVDTTYGRRRGSARPSVNGTSVFSEMFRQAGHKVTTWHRLSPRLERSKVIVWTPNSFALPSEKEVDYLETWLAGGTQRTVIYVARDYDASIDYWHTLARQSQGQPFVESRRQLARVQADHALARSYTGKALKCKWFSVESRASFVPVTPNTGSWLPKLDAKKTKIAVAGRMTFPDSKEVKRETLLGSPEGPLLVRITSESWQQHSQLIVVTNGSMLLNLPLINHEHRKLAGELINSCGPAGRVTFLESDPSGLTISKEDPGAHTGFEAFTVWPISPILLHLTIGGILYCLMVFPICGKPRELMADAPSDFGKHVRALGELMAQTNDRAAALARVRQYHQLTAETTAVENRATGNPFQNPTETHVT